MNRRNPPQTTIFDDLSCQGLNSASAVMDYLNGDRIIKPAERAQSYATLSGTGQKPFTARLPRSFGCSWLAARFAGTRHIAHPWPRISVAQTYLARTVALGSAQRQNMISFLVTTFAVRAYATFHSSSSISGNPRSLLTLLIRRTLRPARPARCGSEAYSAGGWIARRKYRH